MSTPRVLESAGPAKKGRRRSGRTRGGWKVSLPLVGVLGILVAIPAGLVLLAAFSEEVPRPGAAFFGLTLENFSFLGSPVVVQSIINSLVIAVGATVLALAVGGFLAFLTARCNVPGRGFIALVGIMPLFLPGYVGAIAWSGLASPVAGFLNVAAGDLGLNESIVNIYTIAGLIFVLGIYYAPYAYLLIHSSMSLMNPDFEDAAIVHGGSTWRMLRSTTLPLAMPGIAGAGLLIFVLTFENFPIAQALGAPGSIETMPTIIYRMMNDYRGTEAAALALVLVAAVVAVTLVQNRIMTRRSYATVTGKGIKAKRIDLGWFRWVAVAVATAYFLCTIALPIGSLVLTAIRTSPFMQSFAALGEPGALDVFTPFVKALQDSELWSALGNSIGVSLLAAGGGTVLAFVAGYLVYRTSVRGRQVIEALSMVPLAIPAIVMGMGILWTWLLLPVPAYGTLLILIIAFLGVQMPQGFRGVASSIRAVDRDLEDSAVMLGATRRRAIWYVTMPLMRQGLVASFVLLLLLSMRELTVPLFLYTSDTMILSILVFDKYENYGALQEAAATALIYCALMFIVAIIARRFGQGFGRDNK